MRPPHTLVRAAATTAVATLALTGLTGPAHATPAVPATQLQAAPEPGGLTDPVGKTLGGLTGGGKGGLLGGVLIPGVL